MKYVIFISGILVSFLITLTAHAIPITYEAQGTGSLSILDQGVHQISGSLTISDDVHVVVNGDAAYASYDILSFYFKLDDYVFASNDTPSPILLEKDGVINGDTVIGQRHMLLNGTGDWTQWVLKPTFFNSDGTPYGRLASEWLTLPPIIQAGPSYFLPGFSGFELTLTQVPEPATIFLLGIGLIGLLAIARKSKHLV